jgi:carbon storage regulator CsrA
MLTLSRRPKQSIWLGENIEIKILEHSRGITRMGITAPRNVKILCEKLRNRRGNKYEDYFTTAD